MSSLYILEINSLSVVSFAIAFSHSEACLFTLLFVSFTVKKLSSLIRSHLFVFVFNFITLNVGHRGSCCDLCQSVLPMFTSKSFIVSSLMFRSLIRFGFIFVNGVRECSSFILIHIADQFCQHHLLKRLSFCIFLPPLSKTRYLNENISFVFFMFLMNNFYFKVSL